MEEVVSIHSPGRGTAGIARGCYKTCRSDAHSEIRILTLLDRRVTALVDSEPAPRKLQGLDAEIREMASSAAFPRRLSSRNVLRTSRASLAPGPIVPKA